MSEIRNRNRMHIAETMTGSPRYNLGPGRKAVSFNSVQSTCWRRSGMRSDVVPFQDHTSVFGWRKVFWGLHNGTIKDWTAERGAKSPLAPCQNSCLCSALSRAKESADARSYSRSLLSTRSGGS
ncbi:hypothetical protein BDW71DRAFT_6437 [Aspergillus fruticulosus]